MGCFVLSCARLFCPDVSLRLILLICSEPGACSCTTSLFSICVREWICMLNAMVGKAQCALPARACYSGMRAAAGAVNTLAWPKPRKAPYAALTPCILPCPKFGAFCARHWQRQRPRMASVRRGLQLKNLPHQYRFYFTTSFTTLASTAI